LINQRKLRKALEEHLVWEKGYDPSDVGKRISIKRKKKMILEKMTNGNVRAVRRNYLKIEIIE